MMHSKKMKLGICNIIIICFIFMIIFTLFFPNKKPITDAFQLKNAEPIGEIKNKDMLEQRFLCLQDYQKVGILFANYNKVIDHGNLVIKIIDSKKNTKTHKIKLSMIADNSYLYIDYPFKKGENYMIQLTTNNANYPITLYTTKSKVEKASFKYNNQKQNRNIALSFMYMENSYFNIWYYTLSILIVGCYKILIKCNSKESK